ncbi:hypothetical protein ABT382_17090 [Streptomyces pharetrae]|uniref:Phosphatase n=1 Tax=Streptomyces pharetrae CZA14 TaxID=1144883 RepID=A0ABX3YNZ2_9ACTN|nr:hypothetical protein OQI_06870 [Streptomyces pharetrae CZA14]
MSVHEELATVQRCLDDLNRAVNRLEQQMGGGLDIRRVRADCEHLRASAALLRETASGRLADRRQDQLVTISDTPYDVALWTDSDDEGLGARDRRAP